MLLKTKLGQVDINCQIYKSTLNLMYVVSFPGLWAGSNDKMLCLCIPLLRPSNGLFWSSVIREDFYNRYEDLVPDDEAPDVVLKAVNRALLHDDICD